MNGNILRSSEYLQGVEAGWSAGIAQGRTLERQWFTRWLNGYVHAECGVLIRHLKAAVKRRNAAAAKKRAGK